MGTAVYMQDNTIGVRNMGRVSSLGRMEGDTSGNGMEAIAMGAVCTPMPKVKDALVIGLKINHYHGNPAFHAPRCQTLVHLSAVTAGTTQLRVSNLSKSAEVILQKLAWLVAVESHILYIRA